jgi:tetratricopeptide (TPR) repeat protein
VEPSSPGAVRAAPRVASSAGTTASPKTSQIATLPPPPPAVATPPKAVPATARTDVADALSPMGEIERWEAELRAAPSDPAHRGRLSYAIARQYEHALSDPKKASTHYQAALDAMPEHLPSVRGLRRTLLARKSWQAALPLFDREVRLVADPTRKASLLLAKGRMLEDALDQKADARRAYENAFELDRTHVGVLRALADRCADDKSWDALDRVLEQMANVVTSDPRHRAVLVAERAHLAEARLQDPERATELYETAVRLDPRAPGALAALKRLHHGARRWRDLARVLAAEAELADDPRVRVGAWSRVGLLQADRLGNRAEGIAALERAAEIAPDDAEVLGALARLYEDAARWDALATTLEAAAKVATDDVTRVATLHRLGAVQQHRLGNPEHAMHWYRAALEVDPLHEASLRAVEPLLVEHERLDELVMVRRAEADATRDDQRRATALHRVAELLERRGDVVGAIETHSRALAARPGHLPSFRALDRLYAITGRWHELAALHEGAVDLAADDVARVAALLRVAGVFESSIDDPVRAAQTFRRVLELDASHLGALRGWQRNAERAGRTDEVIQALEREAVLTKDAAGRAELLCRAAEVASSAQDREGAVARYRRVLELAPSSPRALAGLTSELRALGRWEDLSAVVEKRAAGAKGAEASALFLELASLAIEHLGREEAGLAHLRKAIELDPKNGAARRELGRRLEGRKDWKALEAFLDAERRREPNVQVLTRLAELREEHLNDVRGALGAWEAVLAERPGDPRALDALARLRTKDRAWGALAADLAVEAKARADVPGAVDAGLREAAVLVEGVDDAKRATLRLEAVLALDPTNLAALRALEALYRRLGPPEAHARVLAAQARVCVDPASRIAALQRQAEVVSARRLATPTEIVAVLDEILRIDPLHRAALEALEAIALETKDAERLAWIDERLAAAADDPGSRAAHLARRGEALEALGRTDALGAFRDALAADESNLAATRGLARMAERLDDPTLLAEAARREAHVAQRPSDVANALVRSARVRLERLGDVEGAIEDLERALEVAPESEEAAHVLSRALRSRSELRRLADRLSQAATSCTVAHRVAALWLEVAELEADALGSTHAGIAAVTRVLRDAPGHLPALRRLASYQRRAGANDAAAETLGRLVAQRPPPDQLVAAHLELADLWGGPLGDPARALVSLQAVLAMAPDHVGALERLAQIEEAAGHFDAARTATSRLVELQKSSDERATAYLRLARLEDARGVEKAAIEALAQAVALVGPGSEAALELKSRCRSASEWEVYASALDRHLASLPAASAAPAFLELARVLHDALARPKAALELLERAFAATRSPDVQRELALRLRGAGRRGEAVEALQALAAHEPTRIEHWRELSRTFLEGGSRREARLALEPLVVLGAATDADRSFLAQEAPRPAAARAGGFVDVLEHLGTPTPEQEAAARLMRSIESALPKLFTADLESFGLVARDRVTSRGGHPLRDLADRIAAALGLESFDLYVHHDRQRGFALEMGAPPLLIVPASLGELPLPQQVFAIARPLVHLARGLGLVEKLTPRELEVLLASAARYVRPGFGGGLTSEELLEDQSKRLYKNLARRQRRPMEEAAQAYVDAGRVDFPRWVRGAHRTAIRVAALLADDLTASLEILRRIDRESPGATGAAWLAASDVARDLVVFWASKPAMHLRRHTGLLGGAG